MELVLKTGPDRLVDLRAYMDLFAAKHQKFWVLFGDRGDNGEPDILAFFDTGDDTSSDGTIPKWQRCIKDISASIFKREAVCDIEYLTMQIDPGDFRGLVMELGGKQLPATEGEGKPVQVAMRLEEGSTAFTVLVKKLMGARIVQVGRGAKPDDVILTVRGKG